MPPLPTLQPAYRLRATLSVPSGCGAGTDSTPPSDSRYYSSSGSLLFPPESSQTTGGAAGAGTGPFVVEREFAFPRPPAPAAVVVAGGEVRLSDLYDEYFQDGEEGGFDKGWGV